MSIGGSQNGAILEILHHLLHDLFLNACHLCELVVVQRQCEIDQVAVTLSVLGSHLDDALDNYGIVRRGRLSHVLSDSFRAIGYTVRS